MINKFRFWGAATVGSKGQIVIPSETRGALAVNEGDKLLIVSPPDSSAIIIVKPDVLEQYMQQMRSGIETMLSEDTEER